VAPGAEHISSGAAAAVTSQLHFSLLLVSTNERATVSVINSIIATGDCKLASPKEMLPPTLLLFYIKNKNKKMLLIYTYIYILPLNKQTLSFLEPPVMCTQADYYRQIVPPN
jgi:hypothetical protein